MKVFWHFFQSNMKYNKIELGISYALGFLVFIAFEYLKEPNTDGEILFSVSFYGLLYAFYSNKRKYNLKYLISLPLSKTELLVNKVTSDLVYFLPSIFLSFWGALHLKMELDKFALVILLVQVVFLISFIMFDSDIEQPRLENARSSFMNRLVYVRKMTNFFFASVFIIYIAVAVNLSPISMPIKQYFLILLLSLILFFKFSKSLKLMKDESLSYFMPKRDMFTIGWKVAVFAIPAITFHMLGYTLPSKYGREKVFSMIQRGYKQDLKEVLMHTPKGLRGKSGYSVVDAAIDVGDLESLDFLLEKGHKIDWKSKLKNSNYEGLRPIHLAVHSGNLDMVKKIVEMKPDSINEPAKSWKTTPLHMASVYCHPEITEYFALKNVPLNQANSKGNTPLILAAKSNCHASLAVLLEYGADVEVKNNKNKTVLNYMHKSMHYLVERKIKKSLYRGVAGSSETEEFPKLQPPKLLHQQK